MKTKLYFSLILPALALLAVSCSTVKPDPLKLRVAPMAGPPVPVAPRVVSPVYSPRGREQLKSFAIIQPPVSAWLVISWQPVDNATVTVYARGSLSPNVPWQAVTNVVGINTVSFPLDPLGPPRFFTLTATALPFQAVGLVWDSSSNPDVTSYNVYYGTSSRGYTNVVSAGGLTNWTIGGLREGETYYFAATAVNAVGLESEYSNEVSYSPPAGSWGVRASIRLSTSPEGPSLSPLVMQRSGVKRDSTEMATKDNAAIQFSPSNEQVSWIPGG